MTTTLCTRASTGTLASKDPTPSLSMALSTERWSLASTGFEDQAATTLVLTGAVEGAVGLGATWSETACSEDL